MNQLTLISCVLLATAACAPETRSEALHADASGSRSVYVGEPVELDGSASTGASLFRWSFGDGGGWTTARRDAVAVVSYDQPGRYVAVLTAFDANGDEDSSSVVVTVTHPPVFAPVHSSSIAALPGRSAVAVVSPDSDEVALFAHDGDRVWLERRFETAPGPRTVFPFESWLVVPCQDADVVELLPLGENAPHITVELPRGARPYGAIATGADIFVTLQGTGQLARIRADATLATAVVADLVDVIPDARGLANLPDGRIAVSRWRSPDDGARIAVFAPSTGDVTPWSLAEDTQTSSDTEIGGVPSYLDQLLVSPDGTTMAVPSLQANLHGGQCLSGTALRHDTMVRAVVSFIDPTTGSERFERRKQFDNRGFASAGVLSSRGDFLYVAMRGSRSVERVDMLSGGMASSMQDVGYAPEGVALSSDDGLLFVNAYLSRELVVYDVADAGALPVELARATIPSFEPLARDILRGKQLFNDSFDPRLARDGYVACAHCHLDGMSDARVWDLTHAGEGLRNTTSLLGHGGPEHGLLHWSGNFDEVQDFEHAIRDLFGGTGLMRDEDFHSGGRDAPLGAPKAGISADLDALASYVDSLTEYEPSPHRDAGEAAARGRALFVSQELGCTSCHAGAQLTDSTLAGPLLHDVGTLGPGSGARLGEGLSGLDTPTLHGVWNSAPYLHDGSAATLREVITARNPSDRHGATSHLSETQLDDLVAYMLSLDGVGG